MKTNVTMSRTMAQLTLQQIQKRIAVLKKHSDYDTCRIGSTLWVEKWDLQRIKSHIERQLSRERTRPPAAANQ